MPGGWLWARQSANDEWHITPHAGGAVDAQRPAPLCGRAVAAGELWEVWQDDGERVPAHTACCRGCLYRAALGELRARVATRGLVVAG